MLQPPTKFEVKFVGDTLSASALIGLMTLTFDLLTWNLVRVIAREVGNLLNNFDILATFLSRLMGKANTCQMDHVTLRLWRLSDTDHRASSVYQV